MGHFTTEIRQNFDDIDRKVGLGDNSIRVTTTYTEVSKREHYPSIETFKSKVIRSLFHTKVQQAGHNLAEVTSTASTLAILAFNAAEIINYPWLFIGLVGTAILSGSRGSSLQRLKEKLESHKYALWKPDESIGYSRFMKSDLKGFLSTYGKSPTK